MSEVAKVFKGLPKKFNKDNVKTPRSFYFSLDDDEKWTVVLGKDKCEVKEGKPDGDADQRRHGHRQDPDEKGDPSTVHDPCQQIASQLIRAKQVPA